MIVLNEWTRELLLPQGFTVYAAKTHHKVIIQTAFSQSSFSLTVRFSLLHLTRMKHVLRNVSDLSHMWRLCSGFKRESHWMNCHEKIGKLYNDRITVPPAGHEDDAVEIMNYLNSCKEALRCLFINTLLTGILYMYV